MRLNEKNTYLTSRIPNGVSYYSTNQHSLMRKFYTFLFTAILVFGLTKSFAQVSFYSFSQSNDVYTPITGGTVLGSTTSDDQRFVDPFTPLGGTATTGIGFPIGFNFTFNGNVFDRVAINNNGWISLGQSALTPSVNNASTSAYTPLSSTTTITPAQLRNRIAGMGRDLQAQAGAELRIQTIGTAPNRSFVVQWTNYKRFGTAGTGDSFNFQIILNETSNSVQVRYGVIVHNTATATSSINHVGLGGSVSTDFHNRQTTVPHNWNSSTAGTLNSQGLQNATSSIAVTVPVPGLTFTWNPPSGCVGTPVAGAITGLATACAGNSVTLTVSGYTAGSGIGIQWKSSTVSGGPYNDIPGATNPTYTLTATGGTSYYIATITCANGGASANTAQHTLVVGAPVHTVATPTIITGCAPGAATLTATAINGAPGNYTHSLTGPGTITPNAPTGPNNSTGNFSIAGIPAGTHTYNVTTLDAFGCIATSPVLVTVNPRPSILVSPTSTTFCAGFVQQLTATANPPITQTFASGTINMAIPDATPAGVTTPPITLPGGITMANASNLRVRINANHSWVGDLIFTLNSPCGTSFLFNRPGNPPTTLGSSSNLGTTNATTPPPAVYIFDVGAATVIPEAATATGFIDAGSYLPSDINGAAHSWAGLAFPCTATGNWTLSVSDNVGGDVGTVVDWAILYDTPSPVVFTPVTGLFMDAAATVPYVAGMPVNTVWTKALTTTTYTATATIGGCSNTFNAIMNVNQPPAITAQPAVAPIVCPGYNLSISVGATGTNITYQWQVSTDNGTTYTNLANTGVYSGVTTATMTIALAPASLNNNRYRCVISGTCTPPATSDAVTLVFGTTPAITTQPASLFVCFNTAASFSVVASSNATPLGYQWQQSTNGGATWTNIAGATAATYTIASAATTMNNYQYRVVVLNSCAYSTTSAAAILTVSQVPVISAQPANATACAGANASFTVANTGSNPAPTIFQWQVSTDAGVTWNNIAGATTATLSLTAVTLAQSGSRYRVIVTNSCGQSITSNGAATLTVNPLPTVTTTALPASICLTDTLVALTGSPVGGNWSGIGVNGFNFVPPTTFPGSYTLTYSYANTFGCTSTSTVVANVRNCPERERLLNNDALVVFPNPSNGRFNVRINSTLYNHLNMRVFNSMGQLVNGYLQNNILTAPVYNGLVYGRVIPVDLTHLPAGVYMVKFYYHNDNMKNEKTFKVVIAR